MFTFLKLAVALALLKSLLTPDFAQSEVWELQDNTWDVRVCAWVVYNVGPFAVNDGSECNQSWTVGVR